MSWTGVLVLVDQLPTAHGEVVYDRYEHDVHNDRVFLASGTCGSLHNHYQPDVKY